MRAIIEAVKNAGFEDAHHVPMDEKSDIRTILSNEVTKF